MRDCLFHGAHDHSLCEAAWQRAEREQTVEVREFYERGPLRVRCHECDAPLFPSKNESAPACDGQNLTAHKHVNIYKEMP